MKIYLLLFSVFTPVFIFAQGMIINEVSNGTSGSGGGAQEYMEFVVIGSAQNPLAAVNLGGWIIDDNNGDFEALGSGVGIAQGHLRIAPNCLGSVRPGSIILIYNDADRNPHIASGASDPNDSNSDCVYIFRASDPCIQACNLRPSTTSLSYAGCTYGSASWTFTGLANSGDASQVRQPDGNFFHGFSYGDVTVPAAPLFPPLLGGGSAFSISGSGTSSVFLFNSGSFKMSTNYSRAASTTNPATTFETPGLPNNNANRYFLNSLRNGTYDYLNLNAAQNTGNAITLDPCPTILAVNLIDFSAEKDFDYVSLNWEIEQEGDEFLLFDIQRSDDAVNFYSIGNTKGYSGEKYFNYKDFNPSLVNYYRLKIIETDSEITYSPIRIVNFDNHQNISVYPNPVKAGSLLHVRLDENVNGIQLYNAVGQSVYSNNSTDNQYEIPTMIAPGIYTLVLELEGTQLIRKLIVE